MTSTAPRLDDAVRPTRPADVPAAKPVAEPRHREEHRYLIAFAVVLAALMQVIDSSIVNQTSQAARIGPRPKCPRSA